MKTNNERVYIEQYEIQDYKIIRSNHSFKKYRNGNMYERDDYWESDVYESFFSVYAVRIA